MMGKKQIVVEEKCKGSSKPTWKQKLGGRLRKSRFYPNMYFNNNPFKAPEYAALVRHISFKPDDVILDLGCGAGLQTLLFGRRARKIIGIDPNPNPVGRAISDHRECAPNIPAEFRVAAIESAGFSDSSFSKIFSVCVLEHIPDYITTLKECFRVLRPGGILSLSCDSLEAINDSEIKRKHAELYQVRHFFTREMLKRDLEQVGFQNVEVRSIFRSSYARKLFIYSIHNGFTRRYSKAICLSWALRLADIFAGNDEGLFLVARAYKPDV